MKKLVKGSNNSNSSSSSCVAFVLPFVLSFALFISLLVINSMSNNNNNIVSNIIEMNTSNDEYDYYDVINECHLLNSISNEQLQFIFSFLSPKSLAVCQR